MVTQTNLLNDPLFDQIEGFLDNDSISTDQPAAWSENSGEPSDR